MHLGRVWQTTRCLYMFLGLRDVICRNEELPRACVLACGHGFGLDLMISQDESKATTLLIRVALSNDDGTFARYRFLKKDLAGSAS